jgi:hypothetical protein
LEDRIQTYDGADIDVARAPRVVVVDDNFYPDVVVTRFQPVRYDPLALVAMPLAVAAVAELTDIPALELASFISLLNQARVPPAQFVEVVRYSPVALIDTRPEFLTFVTTQVSDGTRGMLLARSLADRIEDVYGIEQINVVDPPVIVYTQPQAFVPPVVVQQVAAARTHPHGGPPGQLKKELGLQTGAEVVHGTRPGSATRADSSSRTVETQRTPRSASSGRAAAADRSERAPKEKAKPAHENRGKSQRPSARPAESKKPPQAAPAQPQRGGGKPATASAPPQSRGKAGGGAANAGGAAKSGNQGKGKGKGKG